MMEQLGTRRLALLYTAAAIAGWLAVPELDPPEAQVQARRDMWQLAAIPQATDATSRAVMVAASPIWGAEVKQAKAQAPIENLRWRLAGAFGSGRQGGALVLFDDPAKPAQRLRVGDKLPSGHVIEAVDGNQISIRLGKKLYRLGVEQRD